MKKIEMYVMRGPNYWSARRCNLINLLLDLEEMEDYPTNKIPGFYERLTTLLPSLYTHRCSEGVEGGFFQRVQEGTLMGHVIEHIALEMQTLAGMDTGFGRTRSAGKKGLYNVVFSYLDAEAGLYAAEAAIRVAEALIGNWIYDIHTDIEALRNIWLKNRLGPSTNALVQEARRRNIPVLPVNDAYIQLGYGAAQKRIDATITCGTSNIAVDLACNKAATKQLLEQAGIPVPAGETVTDESALRQLLLHLHFPVVIKPLDGNQGKGVTTNITSMAAAVKAFHAARRYADKVICEQWIKGFDYRVLVINYRFVAAALRTPACVTGDGVHSIAALVQQVNEDARRGEGHENVLTRICIDAASLDLLAQQGYTPASIVPEGQRVYLKTTANLSTGGMATNVTDEVHPFNKILFERIARTVGLDICGIDIMAPGLDTPLPENGGAVLEVNAAPGFRMHLAPACGNAINVAVPVLDMLFPANASGRIPIIAVTGTNGKTTTTRLIAHIAAATGKRVGYTTTDGVYIQGCRVLKGDCTGPDSARMVLQDPAVDIAVLETARGGILRAGLGFDACDIAVITNVAADHLGLKGIDTIEKLARVKAVVAEAVHPGGYAVLNADDDLVYGMRNHLQCHVALFSLQGFTARMQQHFEQRGAGAVYINGKIVLFRDGYMLPLAEAKDLPVTFEGKAGFNIANVLAASLAAYLQGIDIRVIGTALQLFVPSAAQTPGRMNLFELAGFRVMVDYAHNAHGIQAIASFIQSMPASVKWGVIAGVGDRRDEDIRDIGAAAAKLFDKIIIRHDNDLRGRPADDMNRLLCEGIYAQDRFKPITIIPNEIMALETVISCAPKDSLVVFFADDIEAVLQKLSAEQNRQNQHKANGSLAPTLMPVRVA
jgi:cyanophycin synthetase